MSSTGSLIGGIIGAVIGFATGGWGIAVAWGFSIGSSVGALIDPPSFGNLNYGETDPAQQSNVYSYNGLKNSEDKRQPAPIDLGEHMVAGNRHYWERLPAVDNNSVLAVGITLALGKIKSIKRIWVNDIPWELLTGKKGYQYWLGDKDQTWDNPDYFEGSGVGKSLIRGAYETTVDNTLIEEGGAVVSGSSPDGSQDIVVQPKVIEDAGDGGLTDGTDPDPDTGFDGDEPEYQLQLDNAYIYQSPVLDATSLFVAFQMNALGYLNRETGDLEEHSIRISVYYRKVGETNWNWGFTKVKTANSNSKLEWEWLVKDNLEPGQYEVAIINHNDVLDEYEYLDELRLAYHKEGSDDHYNFRGIAKIEFYFIANSQLNYRMPTFKIETEGSEEIEVFSTPSVSTIGYSRNPAWHIYYLLKNHVYDPFPADAFDIQSFIDAATYFDDNDIKCDLVIDNYNSAEEFIQQICTASGMYLRESFGVYSLVIDKDEASTFQFDMTTMVNPAISEDGMPPEQQETISIEPIPVEGKYTHIIATFRNRDLDYEYDEIEVIADDWDKATEPYNPLKVSLPGVSRRFQAEFLVQKMMQHSRKAEVMVSFKATIAALNVDVLNIVNISHELPGWGYDANGVKVDAGPLFRIISIAYGQNDEIQITAINHSPDIHSVTIGTYDPPSFDKVTKCNPVTGLTLSIVNRTDDSGFQLPKLKIDFTKPVDVNFKQAQIWLKSDSMKDYQKVGETPNNSISIDNLTEGKSYSIAVVAVSNSNPAWIASIPESPKASISIPFVTPPNVTFNEPGCVYDGLTIIAEINQLPNYSGYYELRTSNPVDWENDASGKLATSLSNVLTVVQKSTAESITIYAKAKTLKGVYSQSAASLELSKSLYEAVTHNDIAQSNSKNKILNGGVLYNYTTTVNGKVYTKFDNFFSGASVSVISLPESQKSQWGYGPDSLFKDAEDLLCGQDIIIQPKNAARYMTLSYWCTWAEKNSIRYDNPIILFDYMDGNHVSLGTEEFLGTAGETTWFINKHKLTVPAGTELVRMYIKGTGVFDCFMFVEGTLYPQFMLHSADSGDGLLSNLEQISYLQMLMNLNAHMDEITGTIDTFLDRTKLYYELENNAFILKTKAFRLLSGNIEGNYAMIEAMDGTLVLKTNTEGYISQIALGSTGYGSVINLNSDQLNVSAFTVFTNGKNLVENINASLTLIDGGMLQSDTIISNIIFSGAALEINSSTPTREHPVYGTIATGVYLGCSANPLDTDPARARFDMDGNFWIGAVNFGTAPFTLNPHGDMLVNSARFNGTIRVDASFSPQTSKWSTAQVSNDYVEITEDSIGVYYTAYTTPTSCVMKKDRLTIGNGLRQTEYNKYGLFEWDYYNLTWKQYCLSIYGLVNITDSVTLLDFNLGTADEGFIKPLGYMSADGTKGISQTIDLTSITSLTVKNGLVVGAA